MRQDEKLQVAGPTVLVGAISCAVLSAHALAQWPSSSWAWYLNLEVFRAFEYGSESGLERGFGQDGLGQALLVGSALLALICVGVTLKTRLALAVASHLSLLYSAAALIWAETSSSSGPFCPSSFLGAAILLSSILSSTISHREYWREIFR
jgi:hypothetical protein